MAGRDDFLNPLVTAGFRVRWITRIQEVDTKAEREDAVSRLMPFHLKAVCELGGQKETFWLSEQVHGNIVVPVKGQTDGIPVTGADGLTTNDSDAVLGIYVADCGALYLGDPVKKAVSVLHSGRVGTEKNILGAGVKMMMSEYGSKPEDIVVCLAPCIRPPAYEVDFAKIIAEQAIQLGIKKENYHDCGVCTTSDLSSFYSYRAEKGKTGRMLALIAV